MRISLCAFILIPRFPEVTGVVHARRYKTPARCVVALLWLERFICDCGTGRKTFLYLAASVGFVIFIC